MLVACGSGDDEVSFGGEGGTAGTNAAGRSGNADTGGSSANAGASQGGKGGTSSKGGTGGTSSKGGSGGSGTTQGGAAGVDGVGGSDVGGSGGTGAAGKGGTGSAGNGGKGGTGGSAGKGGNGAGGKGGTTAGNGGAGPVGAGGSLSAGNGGTATGGTGGTDAAGAGGSDTAGAGGGQNGGAAGAPPLPICGDGIINRPNEACDGQDFGAQPPGCPPGWTGTVVCSSTCQRDTSDCVAPSSCGNGKIDDGETCDNKNPRCKACQVACNADEKLFEGHCYGGTAPLSWGDAESNCVGRGGHLVSIGSNAENEMVFDLAGGNGNLPLASKIWLGLNDRKTEGAFTWVSGSPSGYRNFRDGEPNAATSNEDCVAMYLALGTWNDDECGKTFVGICEFNPQAP